jgi:hypothetical protein
MEAVHSPPPSAERGRESSQHAAMVAHGVAGFQLGYNPLNWERITLLRVGFYPRRVPRHLRECILRIGNVR